ncbi:sigma-54 dependent transcriptional regulator [Accumulibacter sp.]|jgi:two-component system response regulator HupR/HoxA|uniref:sigma-54-dependent transcriptional regulator n=1 Tax=Accumulibacter sp. TaxID=2053492 RepID=UPI001AD21A58|nr:sigma-54 dependent transcriptional regulator [Accumulibacter sp.]MBN8454066.1 sigma-54-dependent Fis family transcriptional regulator [Accumulibacter sp.]MBO3708672.1 sigma-54-dependent Fis family transcriptional regulator [Candidatus Accumulibacter conexus]
MTGNPKQRLPTVLVVDDELRSREALRRTLDEDFEVLTAANAEEAQRIMESEWVQIIVCDQRMPGTSGVEFLRRVRSQWPDTLRIILSGYTDAEDIIAGVNEAGIYQYLLKPWQPEQLLLTLQTAASVHRLQQENQRLSLELRTAEPVLARRVDSKQERARREFALDGLIRSPQSPLNAVCELVERIAPFDLSVLISGESGTGKEMLARAIHYCSRRSDKAFVVEHCGALPDQLLEAELFGYKRGAFTGAYEDRSGRFQQADGGTIFLDEIGDTSPVFQVKLLRVLQEGEFRPLGAARPQSVDVRVVAATHHDLEAEVRAGTFREDLYYRLATVTLRVPPLRERAMDIPLLAGRLLDASQKFLGKSVAGFSTEALACLAAYPWPGNVRELQNEILRMLALADTPQLGADLLAPRILRTPAVNQQEDQLLELIPLAGGLRERMDALEARVLKETLIRHRWNKSRAASELGLSRVGLRSKLVRYGLERG